VQGSPTGLGRPDSHSESFLATGAGLVLEGGGMRGAYTAGVLDAFLDQRIDFSYVIGVSAGANAGANYVVGQRERNHKMFVELAADRRYAGPAILLQERSWFSMRFLFETTTDYLVPFDFEAFRCSPRALVVAATDCATGRPAYFCQHDHDPRRFVRTVHPASCSWPLLSQPVAIDGHRYFDGGVSDPIPIDRSISDGNPRNVVVLTHNGSRRRSSRFVDVSTGLVLARYPGVRRALGQRDSVYNACLDRLAALEQSGRVFLIRPSCELGVGPLERDVAKLEALYRRGYDDVLECLPALRAWVAASPA